MSARKKKGAPPKSAVAAPNRSKVSASKAKVSASKAKVSASKAKVSASKAKVSASKAKVSASKAKAAVAKKPSTSGATQQAPRAATSSRAPSAPVAVADAVDRPLVLLVDDFPDAREMYLEYLEFSGFVSAEASNGLEAIETARSLSPAVILMDLAMPVMDGWEATRTLKADPRTRSIPVIAVTGHALEGDAELARKAGCDGVLSKPCLPETLVAEVRRVLGATIPGRTNPGRTIPGRANPGRTATGTSVRSGRAK